MVSNYYIIFNVIFVDAYVVSNVYIFNVLFVDTCVVSDFYLIFNVLFVDAYVVPIFLKI